VGFFAPAYQKRIVPEEVQSGRQTGSELELTKLNFGLKEGKKEDWPIQKN